MRSVFVSPHDDDHALFGAFTCLRENPILVVVFDSYVQAARGLPVTRNMRTEETARAAAILNCKSVLRLGFRDDQETTPNKIRSRAGELLEGLEGCKIYAPAFEPFGHRQHNLCADAFPLPAIHYLTYATRGKSVGGLPVPIESGTWIHAKLRALAEYSSQMSLDPRMGCWPHFLRDQTEYYQ